MLAVVLAASLVGVHYEHPQAHFSVELPKEWAPAEPQASDPTGVIFNRNTNDRLTICSIHAVALGDTSLQDFVLAIAAASQGELGYKSIASGASTLGGVPAYRRKFSLFIDPHGQFTKTVEERVVVIDHVGYVVHAEGFTHWFNSRTRDFDQMFKTFAVGGGSARSNGTLPCPFRDWRVATADSPR